MIADTLKDPALVTMAREDGFRYNNKKIKFDNRYTCTFIDGSRLYDDHPVIVEYRKQYWDWCTERTQKARKKRDAFLAEKLELAKTSTMTAFEWRVKLWKEHGLLLVRRPYGMGDFLCYITAFNPVAIKGNQIKSSMLHFEEADWICGFSAYGVYTDGTINDCVEKVKTAIEREKDKKRRNFSRFSTCCNKKIA